MNVKIGEVRKVGFEFTNTDGESFVIDGVDFEIVDDKGNVELSGAAQVEGHKVFTIFNGTKAGTYTVKFSCHIGSEIYKPSEVIRVLA